MKNQLHFAYFLVVKSILLFSCSTLAAKELRWTHFGVRPLAMGNAYVAIADDFNALFYNPAGLARISEWDGELLNPTFQIADHTLSFISDLTQFLGGSSSSFTSALELIRPQLGRIHHFSMSISPHLIFKGFGFGIGMENTFNIVPHSDIDFEIEAGTNIIAPISYARNFLEDRLSVGASIKVLSQAKIDDSFNIDAIPAFSQSNNDDPNAKKLEDMIKAGYGVGFDLGLLYTPFEKMSPTLGISITDIGGSSYQSLGSDSVGVPSPLFPSINTGISAVPWKKTNMYLRVAADVHMINQPIHFSHKLNLGAEWGLSNILKIQTGLKEGYFSGGLQFDVGLLNLRIATYHVDHAPVVGINKNFVEKRYAIQLKLII